MNSIYSSEYRKKPHLPAVCAYYDRADMGATTPHEIYHLHSVSEFMYVYEGEAEVLIRPAVSVSLRNGEYIWLDAFVAHKLVIKKDRLCSMMNVEFDLLAQGTSPGPGLDSLCRESGALRDMLDHPVPYLALHDEGNAVFRLLKQIISQEDGGLPGHQARSSMLAAGLILMTASLRRSQGEDASPSGRQYADRALEIIRARCGERLTAASLAAALHIHPSYLHKLFRKHTGQTIGGAIRSVRMEAARQLLAQTRQSLPDIACAVGIANTESFTRLFRRSYGQSPIEYRSSLS